MSYDPFEQNSRDWRRHTARLAPGLSTTTILIAARVWSEQGARHSFGDAVLMGALTLGAAAAGTVSAKHANGHYLLTTTCYAAAGTTAVCGAAAYSDGLALPILLWLLATVAVYALAARYWREDRRTATAHANTYELRSMERGTDLQIARTTAKAKVEAAHEASAYMAALADAVRERRRLADTGGVPALDVDVLLAAGLPGGLPEVPDTPAALLQGPTQR
ncbi:hypothetical protein [Kitasatospora purpeofusca]|uniref:hypothetical protein n=1 Tax=Kitasatospora purpeofusca TaxID=67352 RepID=UPI00068A8206|nr:hypothetical protein [Kitasatospora purpeofusca]